MIHIDLDSLTCEELKSKYAESVKKLVKVYDDIDRNTKEKNKLSHLVQCLEDEIEIRKMRNMTIGDVK